MVFHRESVERVEFDSLEKAQDVLADEQERRQFLATAAIFSCLAMEHVEQLVRHAQLVKYSAGETLIFEGTLGDRFFLVVHGTVSVFAEIADSPRAMKRTTTHNFINGSDKPQRAIAQVSVTILGVGLIISKLAWLGVFYFESCQVRETEKWCIYMHTYAVT
jgi:CRP-like cAMP-binding protein